MKKFNKLFGCLLVGMAIIPSTTLALSKTETIYTNLDSDGNVTKSVVNNHLKLIIIFIYIFIFYYHNILISVFNI